MHRMRNVKVLATLGPASASEEKIRALFEAGADAFRLNMSHGTHEGVREMYERKLEEAHAALGEQQLEIIALKKLHRLLDQDERS